MTPRTRFWTVTIAAAGTVALTASLGVWQLARAAQKQALETGIAERGAMAELDGAAVLSANGAFEPPLHHAHVLKCGPRSWRTKLQGGDLHS